MKQSRKYDVELNVFLSHLLTFKKALSDFRELLDALPEREKDFFYGGLKLLKKQYKEKGRFFVKVKRQKIFSDNFFHSPQSISFYLFLALHEFAKEFAPISEPAKALYEQSKFCLKLGMDVVNTKYVVNVINMVYLTLLKRYPFIVNYKEDLRMESVTGVLSALFKYEMHKQVKFSTYAYYWVKKYMLNFILNNNTNHFHQFQDNLLYKNSLRLY